MIKTLKIKNFMLEIEIFQKHDLWEFTYFDFRISYKHYLFTFGLVDMRCFNKG